MTYLWSYDIAITNKNAIINYDRGESTISSEIILNLPKVLP